MPHTFVQTSTTEPPLLHQTAIICTELVGLFHHFARSMHHPAPPEHH